MILTIPVGETAPVGAQAMAPAVEMATTPVLAGATVPVTALETALALETAPALALAQDGAKAPAGAPAVAGATAPATAHRRHAVNEAPAQVRGLFLFALGDFFGYFLQKGVRMDTLLRGYGTQPRWTFPGMIMPFSGTFGGDGGRYPIPLDSTAPLTDWVLCDGVETNGFAVPDLRDKMITCAGNKHAAGSTGGAETHTHSVSGNTSSAGSHSHEDTFSTSSAGSHSHTVSGSVGSTTLSVSQMPSHTHKCTTAATDQDAGYFTAGSDLEAINAIATAYTGGSSSHTHSLSSAETGTAGSHTHSISGSVSSGGAHTHSMDVTSKGASNMPPYYALAYIMCVRA